MIQETNGVKQNKKLSFKLKVWGVFFQKLQLSWNIVNGCH